MKMFIEFLKRALPVMLVVIFLYVLQRPFIEVLIVFIFLPDVISVLLSVLVLV